ncbi:unnamed protein product [Eruca vesicaria subsp. sativa]|uniref:NYN domain-containing protein n=1 Tax=Eruca vesicaria subsp. sativa TaxID=29727 RepID=A0ABC8IN62_ERUVS|nr:unnamed protein product [Eruca vesicaria subsp. sativa]
MGTVTVRAIFAKMTEHIPIDMVAKLSANKIKMVNMGLYYADAADLINAADNAIICEIEQLMLNDEQGPCNVMVLSGDHIFHQPLKTLKEQGYRTLAAFRTNIMSDETELNAQVWDSEFLDLFWIFLGRLGKSPIRS